MEYDNLKAIQKTDIIKAVFEFLNSNKLYKKNKKFYNIDIKNNNIILFALLIFILDDYKEYETIENFIIRILEYIDLNILIYLDRYVLLSLNNINLFDIKFLNNEELFLTNYYPIYIENIPIYPLTYLNIIYFIIFKNKEYNFNKLIDKLKSEIQDIKKINNSNLTKIIINRDLLINLYNSTYKHKIIFDEFYKQIFILKSCSSLCFYDLEFNKLPNVETNENNIKFIKMNNDMIDIINFFIKNKDLLNVELNNNLINFDLCSDTLNNSKPLIDYGIFQYVHLDIEYNQNQLFSLNDEYKYFNLLINKKFIENFNENHKIIISGFKEGISKFKDIYDNLSYIKEYKELTIYEFKKILLNNQKINFSIIYELENNKIHNLTVFKNNFGIFIFDPAGKYNNYYGLTQKDNEILEQIFNSLFGEYKINKDLNVQAFHDYEIIKNNNQKIQNDNKCFYYCMLFSQYIIKNNIEIKEENYYNIIYDFYCLLNKSNNQTLFINNCLVYSMMQATALNPKSINSNLTDIIGMTIYGYDVKLLFKFFIFGTLIIEDNKSNIKNIKFNDVIIEQTNKLYDKFLKS